ncbi:helix-turn-helix domain-containing protein [Fimbriiglobus ruber]|uniref:helix-turn-helix domain-containing protein n=1 Tax=Fimbriiglobus ruber TaxID=1908690 RepID=UPI000B4BC8EB
MGKRSVPIQHAGIVDRFAARLREVRTARGMTQVELARRANVTPNYIGRLENAGAAPGIDLVERLATALGTTSTDLLPTTAPADPQTVLREQAHRLLDRLVQDQEALTFLVPLMARLAGGRIAPGG